MGRSETESMRSPSVDFWSGDTVHLDIRVGEERPVEQSIFRMGYVSFLGNFSENVGIYI